MKIELIEDKEIDFFTDIWKLVTSMVEEVPLQITKEGLVVYAMDPSHVAMIDLKIKSSAFSGYEVENPIRLNFNAQEFKKRLESVSSKKGEKLTIRHDPDKARIVFDIVNPATYRKRQLGLSLFDNREEEEIPDPKIIFHSNALFPLEDMEQALKDAGMISEHIRVRVFREDKEDKEKITFEATGEFGDSFLEVNTIHDIKIDTEALATFTTTYLNNFIGGIKPLAKTLRMQLSTDMPIRLEVNENKFDCSFFLAPCIG